MYQALMALFILFFTLPAAAADSNVPLTRNDVASLKKVLQAAYAALGQPPAGYSKEEETFNLPTEAYASGKAGTFNPAQASLDCRFGSSKAAKKSQEELSKEYQKKMADAMAKGDYQAMGQISQEMQQAVGRAQQDQMAASKEPIQVHIRLNSGVYQAIDPDGVLMEKPGVIALLIDKNEENRNRVEVYFDPVSLKQTDTLSRVELRQPKDGVAKKTAVLHVTIEFTGPAADVADWAKRINTSVVLGQIDK